VKREREREREIKRRREVRQRETEGEEKRGSKVARLRKEKSKGVREKGRK